MARARKPTCKSSWPTRACCKRDTNGVAGSERAPKPFTEWGSAPARVSMPDGPTARPRGAAFPEPASTGPPWTAAARPYWPGGTPERRAQDSRLSFGPERADVVGCVEDTPRLFVVRPVKVALDPVAAAGRPGGEAPCAKRPNWRALAPAASIWDLALCTVMPYTYEPWSSVPLAIVACANFSKTTRSGC